MGICLTEDHAQQDAELSTALSGELHAALVSLGIAVDEVTVEWHDDYQLDVVAWPFPSIRLTRGIGRHRVSDMVLDWFDEARILMHFVPGETK